MKKILEWILIAFIALFMLVILSIRFAPDKCKKVLEHYYGGVSKYTCED